MDVAQTDLSGLNRHEVRCNSIIMVGTDPDGKGGIASVVRAYMGSTIFTSYPVAYIAVHREGGAFMKMKAAAQGWSEILSALMRMDAPVLHIHLSCRASVWRKLIVCKLAAAFDRPYILHVHASEFMEFFEKECGPKAQEVVRRMFSKAALTLALSEQWRTQLAGIAPDARIEVLPNAVSLPDLSSRAPGDNDRATILFMGRLGARKGTADLIKAFAKVAGDFPGTRLICAGDGESAPFRRLAVELGIDERVQLPGWLGTEQCRELLREALVFVLPSYAEGLPMALLEAMSWRLAVISSPVGGIPQLIRYGENGLLVEAGDVQGLSDALRTLLSRPRFRERLAAEARRTIEKDFSLAAHIEALSRIYASFGLQPLASAANDRQDAAGDRAPTTHPVLRAAAVRPVSVAPPKPKPRHEGHSSQRP